MVASNVKARSEPVYNIRVKTFTDKETNLWFYTTLLYVVFDYSRVFEAVGLGTLRPMMLLNMLLMFLIFFRGGFGASVSRQTTLMWVFILLLACHIPFARNNYLAFTTTKAQILYMPFILSTIVCVHSVRRLKIFVFTLIVLEIYIGICAFFYEGHGPGNYFEDENDLALYMNMWIPFCYFLIPTEKNKFRKVILIGGLVIGVLAVVVSFSRGGFLGLISMGVVLCLLSKHKIRGLIVVGVLAGVMFLFAGDIYWKEMGTAMNAEEGTGKQRIEFWKSAWNMFTDNPLGVGGNNFQVRFPEYQTEFFRKNMWGRVSHSLWFTLLSELGVFGVLIYFSLLYQNFKDVFAMKNAKYEEGDEEGLYLDSIGRAFIASLVGFYASATFLSVLYYASYWYMTGLIVATRNVARQNSEETM